MQDKPKLVLLDGETLIQEFPLESGDWIVGRSRTAAIKIEDPEASSQHMIVRVKGNEAWAKDNGSKNGTFLNEKPLRGEVLLSSGDIIRIGAVCLRFESSLGVAADVPPAAAAKEADDDGKTRFMPLPDEGGTRILDNVAAVAAAAGGGHDDGTNAFPENATRMLEADELKGLQSSQKPGMNVGKVIAGVCLVLAFLGAAFLMTKKPEAAKVDDSGSMATYHDQLIGFEVGIPESWDAKGKSSDGLVSFTGRDAQGARGQVDVMTETKSEYEMTALSAGFDQYMEETKAKYPELVLSGSKPMDLNEVRVMFYGYSAKGLQGKGIFLLHGDQRIVVEGRGSSQDYGAHADSYSTILQTFKLYQDQKYFDFDPPDDAIRRTALANPNEAQRLAKEHYLVGKDLLRKRDVQLDNLYRAIREFKKSLQYSSTQSSRPSVYGEAADELKYALQLFQEAVRRQRFEINLAFKQGDRQTTYWEANKLMQMIPDKSDPIYQEASLWVNKLTKKKKR